MWCCRLEAMCTIVRSIVIRASLRCRLLALKVVSLQCRVIEGELILVENGSETGLRAGDCAAFPKGSGNGRHMVNRSGAMAVYLEVGSWQHEDLTTCADIDMMTSNADGRLARKDGHALCGARVRPSLVGFEGA
jgi:hypothetical protein